MPKAAVPNYLGDSFDEASPALRFNLLLPVWTAQWKKDKQARYVAKPLSGGIQNCLNSLVDRQASACNSLDKSNTLVLLAKSTAPFATGLGNAHPLENGFSFLNPYGLPYLPGSGVKGVLRRAAQELAKGEWGDTKGWRDDRGYCENSRSMTEVLFGNEPEAGKGEHLRGALSFWDVIPQISSDLKTEVMTPHYTHYYQGDEFPHDSGSPVPIFFLTVPPGSTFTFHVTCDSGRLARFAKELADDGRWKCLLTTAFEHAFDWLGFGAKTSVGYGAMRRDSEAEKKVESERKAAEEQQRHEEELAKLSPVERQIKEIIENRPNKNEPEITTIYSVIRANETWQGEERAKALQWLAEELGKVKKSALGNAARKKHDQRVKQVQAWLQESSS